MPLYKEIHLDNDADIHVWEITESEDDLLKLCSIPTDEFEELKLFKKEGHRREKLAVRALLDHIFPEKVYLEHHDNGKPFLENRLTEISISHTTRFVAIITHPEEVVGIDIESLNRDFSAVEKKALSDEEREDLSRKHHNFQLAIYWCAKEAIYKRMSQRGVDFAEQIEIEQFTPRESGKLHATFIHKSGKEEEFELEYETVDDHVMVWMVG